MKVVDPGLRTTIQERVRAMFDCGLEAWSEMFDFRSTVHGSGTRLLRCHSELVDEIVGDGALLRTCLLGFDTLPILFVFPSSLLGAAVGCALMAPEAKLDPEAQHHVEAVQELMNLFCGSATQALQDCCDLDLRVSQSVDDLVVDLKDIHASELTDQKHAFCVHVDIDAGDEKARTWCLLGVDAATILGAAPDIEV